MSMWHDYSVRRDAMSKLLACCHCTGVFVAGSKITATNRQENKSKLPRLAERRHADGKCSTVDNFE